MNKRIFITLFLAVFSTTLGVGLVVPILPVYAHKGGAGGLEIGLIFGVFSLSRSALVPFFGRWSDRRGRKVFLTTGLFFFCLVSIAFTFSENIHWLIGVRFFHGISSAMVLPVALAYVGELSPPDREGETMGTFQISLLAGLSIGPLMGGIINDSFGINAAFLGMGTVCFVGFLLCLILLPKETRDSRYENTIQTSYLRTLKDRSVLILFIHRISLACSVGVIWAFLPLMGGSTLHLNSTSMGMVLMINLSLSAVFQYPMGLVADRFDKRIPVLAGGLCATAGILALAGAQGFRGILVAATLHGLALGFIMPSVMAAAVIVGREKKSMGTIMGLVSMAQSLGMLVGPVFGGMVMDVFHFSGVFSFGAFILLAGTMVFLLAIPKSLVTSSKGISRKNS